MCSRRRAIKWKARPTRLTTTLFSSRYHQMMFPTRQLCFRLGSIFFINMNNRQLSGVWQGHLFKRWSSGRGSNPTVAPGHQQGKTCTSCCTSPIISYNFSARLPLLLLYLIKYLLNIFLLTSIIYSTSLCLQPTEVWTDLHPVTGSKGKSINMKNKHAHRQAL